MYGQHPTMSMSQRASFFGERPRKYHPRGNFGLMPVHVSGACKANLSQPLWACLAWHDFLNLNCVPHRKQFSSWGGPRKQEASQPPGYWCQPRAGIFVMPTSHMYSHLISVSGATHCTDPNHLRDVESVP